MRPTTNRKLTSCVLLLLLRKLKATDPPLTVMPPLRRPAALMALWKVRDPNRRGLAASALKTVAPADDAQNLRKGFARDQSHRPVWFAVARRHPRKVVLCRILRSAPARRTFAIKTGGSVDFERLVHIEECVRALPSLGLEEPQHTIRANGDKKRRFFPSSFRTTPP